MDGLHQKEAGKKDKRAKIQWLLWRLSCSARVARKGARGMGVPTAGVARQRVRGGTHPAQRQRGGRPMLQLARQRQRRRVQRRQAQHRQRRRVGAAQGEVGAWPQQGQGMG